jgi:hypothetical protein
MTVSSSPHQPGVTCLISLALNSMSTSLRWTIKTEARLWAAPCREYRFLPDLRLNVTGDTDKPGKTLFLQALELAGVGAMAWLNYPRIR